MREKPLPWASVGATTASKIIVKYSKRFRQHFFSKPESRETPVFIGSGQNRQNLFSAASTKFPENFTKIRLRLETGLFSPEL